MGRRRRCGDDDAAITDTGERGEVLSRTRLDRDWQPQPLPEDGHARRLDDGRLGKSSSGSSVVSSGSDVDTARDSVTAGGTHGESPDPYVTGTLLAIRKVAERAGAR